LSAHPSVGICGSVTSFGSSCNGSIGAQLNLAAQNRLHASVIHDQKDQVGCFSADLEADTATLQRVHGRCSPWSTELLPGPANHCAAPVACSYTKCKFSNRRNDNDAFGLFQELMRNVVWDVEDFLHHDAALFEAFLLLVQFRGVYCTCYQRETCCCYHEFLHC